MSNAKEIRLAQDVLKILDRAYRKVRMRAGGDLMKQMLFILLYKWFPLAKVEQILKTLADEYVDLNELRVSHTTEIEASLESAGFPAAQEAAQAIKDLLTGYHLLRNDLEEDYYRELPLEEKRSLLEGISVLDPFMIHYLMLAEQPPATVLHQISLSRVAQRVGLIGRTSSPRKVVVELEKLGLGPDLLALQLHLVRLGSETCLSRGFDCPSCKLQKLCAMAARERARSEARERAKAKVAKRSRAGKSKSGKSKSGKARAGRKSSKAPARRGKKAGSKKA